MKTWVSALASIFFLTAVFAMDGNQEASSSYLFFTPQMMESHLKSYSADEKQLIEKDLQVVRSVCFEGVKPAEKAPFFLTTAGGPGARKSTILERFVAAHPDYQGGAYLDPDQRGLKFMPHTYYAQSLTARNIAENPEYSPVVRAAYEKWRGASNYITLKLMEEAFGVGDSVVHGSTSTGPHISNFFTELHNHGYEITMLLCSSKDEFRFDAVKYRNEEQRFYQSTPEDALSKGKLFSERMGIYFGMADHLYLYWSDSLQTPEQLAAVFSNGKMQLVDQGAFKKFVEKYEADRLALQAEGKTVPAWQDLVKGS